MEVASEIWEQAASTNQQVTVEELSRTISDAQNIVKTRLLDINGTPCLTQTRSKS
jgi:hypothetical protein